LKNNTDGTNSKCYDFACSTLLRFCFTSNLKKLINIWPHLKKFLIRLKKN